MFECPICTDEVSEDNGVQTPCCQRWICRDCVDGSGAEALVEYNNDRYRCLHCKEDVTRSEDYADMLRPEGVRLIQVPLDVLRVDVIREVIDPQTIRINAWQFGAYTHSPGCGHPVSVIEGCDAMKCPGCREQINIGGGEAGDHSGTTVSSFFGEIQNFDARTKVGQLDLLEQKYPKVWASRCMDELVEGVRDGTLVEWTGSMAEHVWGGFPSFLRARIAPQPEGPDDSSLFALIKSIGATSTDGAALTRHYYEVEEKPGNEIEVNRARRSTRNLITDQRVKEILRLKLSNNTWWSS